MPVILERIPEKRAKPPRPVTRRWLIFGVVVLAVGMGLTFLFWEGERSGSGFWLFAVVLPLLLWGAIFSARRAGYKYQSVGQDAANRRIEARHDHDKNRGQRFAWFVGEYLVNALERQHVATQSAALAKTPVLQPVMPRGAGKPVRHSRLAEEGSAPDVLNGYQYEVVEHINVLLDTLPETMTCYLALDLAEDLPDISLSWLSGITRPVIHIRDLSGLQIIDYWLDYHYAKPSALLVISAQLNDVPADDSGEALAVVLMTNCRLNDTPLLSARIHRPQINHTGDMRHALRHATLWAGLGKDAQLRGWITGGQLASSDTLSTACDHYAPELTAQRYVNIDSVAGFAGVTAAWQALILAARQCIADQEAQLVVTESSPDYRQLCAVTPE
ncbi:hypothetical protein FS595_08505 [Serratia rubidaea]|uniref:hypothetical protein n=1 Tax=Serratia rubidaea TaxID=61652 RepID=UPI001F25F73B|nr:hypothetical protein [Serratia rubidaea]UJD79740.1 hypothetical protein FS596_08505 [Serratia rubidaea]UJD84296.1 hypothetical protein FS595_08505 [Serratia rubidaea]